MWESKWGVLERFRLKPEWRGKVLAEDREFLSRAIAARGALLEHGAYVLGPFWLPAADGEWWTVLWQFKDRAAAAELEQLVADPHWSRFLETRLEQGSKYDPIDGFPDF